MLKKSLLLVFLFLLFGQTYAQDDTTKHKKLEHQLAINATNFIQTLISFNGSVFNNTPYNFQYKFLEWNSMNKYAFGLRTGFGYLVNNSKLEQPNNVTETRSTSYNYRIGFEYQYKLKTRWTLYTGLDFVYGKNDIISSSASFFNNQTNKSEVKNFSKSAGIGPVLGIQFNISKRLALGTELTVYSISTKQDRKIYRNGIENTGSSFKQSQVNSSISVPSFIYFIIRI
ncbi:MAG: hypothetical protein GC180_08020 [Bacteroidetes bacterium]|nr:hypothetical protein [Bacteroidota bacterium]